MLKRHDIIVALKLIRADSNADALTYGRLSEQVGLSASETHAAVERGMSAGLLRRHAPSRRSMPVTNLTALREFLVHGLKYVWPAERGALCRGVPTATSDPRVAERLHLTQPVPALVWPHPEGALRGEAVQPLHPKAASLCLKDGDLHEWLALIDIIRLKAGREASLAAAEIDRRLR